MNIKNDKMNKIEPLQVGDGKEEKQFKVYTFFAELGERVLAAFYINFKL